MDPNLAKFFFAKADVFTKLSEFIQDVAVSLSHGDCGMPGELLNGAYWRPSQDVVRAEGMAQPV